MSRLTDLERALTRAAERLDREEAAQATGRPAREGGEHGPARARTRRRGWRLPLLVTVATLGLGGGAFAALDLLPTGAPVPEADGPAAPATVAGTERVLDVRAPDPEGGPAWGIWSFRQRGPGGRGRLDCEVPGRVQDDVIGVVGRDGVFGDDGRFHPLQTRSSSSTSCGSVLPDGTRFRSGDGPTVPASGYSGAPGPPVGGCREDVPASTMSPQTRRRLRDVPVCDRRGQRIVKWGFAGPTAVRITYGNDRWSRTIRPERGDSGAYIFVLRPQDASGGGELVLTTVLRDGTRCFQTRGSGPGGPGCTPPFRDPAG